MPMPTAARRPARRRACRWCRAPTTPGPALGRTPGSVLHTLQQWLDQGTLRRFGVVVRHHELGFDANAMTVFDIPTPRSTPAWRHWRMTGVTLAYRRERAPRAGPTTCTAWCMAATAGRAGNVARAIAEAAWRNIRTSAVLAAASSRPARGASAPRAGAPGPSHAPGARCCRRMTPACWSACTVTCR